MKVKKSLAFASALWEYKPEDIFDGFLRLEIVHPDKDWMIRNHKGFETVIKEFREIYDHRPADYLPRLAADWLLDRMAMMWDHLQNDCAALCYETISDCKKLTGRHLDWIDYHRDSYEAMLKAFLDLYERGES